MTDETKREKDPSVVLDSMRLQSAEFDAMSKLWEAWGNLRQVAIVDDDYPMYRTRYETTMREYVKAVRANRGDDPTLGFKGSGG